MEVHTVSPVSGQSEKLEVGEQYIWVWSLVSGREPLAL